LAVAEDEQAEIRCLRRRILVFAHAQGVGLDVPAAIRVRVERPSRPEIRLAQHVPHGIEPIPRSIDRGIELRRDLAWERLAYQRRRPRLGFRRKVSLRRAGARAQQRLHRFCVVDAESVSRPAQPMEPGQQCHGAESAGDEHRDLLSLGGHDDILPAARGVRQARSRRKMQGSVERGSPARSETI
jgi:hypothetical protein